MTFAPSSISRNDAMPGHSRSSMRRPAVGLEPPWRMGEYRRGVNRVSVRLVWITPEAESLIVHMARVSNPVSQASAQNPERLIAYLIKHKHWSPFEMASACVEIETTRDIGR